jgi:hypothetical protein
MTWIFKVTRQQCIVSVYILEQRSSRGTLRIHPSWPCSGHRLNPILASPYEHASCCHAQPGVQLFMTTVQVSPQRLLLSGWLLTNVQVNITTALHDTGHTCIYITLVLLFMFFFTFLPLFWAGWLSSIPFVRYLPLHILKERVMIETRNNNSSQSCYLAEPCTCIISYIN